MSRIEEALKRASVSTGPRNLYSLRDSRAVTAETSTLADYPEEESGEPTRSAPPAPVATSAASNRRSVAATLGPFPKDLEGKLILTHAGAVAVEQYRRLAATLHELQAAHGAKTLMVTSAVPREGKTLTISNLALTLSESYGRRVLLIDADLRRPSIHEVFGIPNNKPGLSEGLRTDAAELSLVPLSSRLSVLPAGKPDSNPMAGLTSQRMRTLLDEAVREFDWVLLDAPPVGIMPDANLLARLTQGVIFVLAAGMTPHPVVERAINDLGRDSIVGTVLNRITDSDLSIAEGYDHYSYASIASS